MVIMVKRRRLKNGIKKLIVTGALVATTAFTSIGTAQARAGFKEVQKNHGP